jgi:hypothetical protein
MSYCLRRTYLSGLSNQYLTCPLLDVIWLAIIKHAPQNECRRFASSQTEEALRAVHPMHVSFPDSLSAAKATYLLVPQIFNGRWIVDLGHALEMTRQEST